MCIRDRGGGDGAGADRGDGLLVHSVMPRSTLVNRASKRSCLLYTSDAADERSSVDLGGRRIIKKKTTMRLEWSICAVGQNTPQAYVSRSNTRKSEE